MSEIQGKTDKKSSTRGCLTACLTGCLPRLALFVVIGAGLLTVHLETRRLKKEAAALHFEPTPLSPHSVAEDYKLLARALTSDRLFSEPQKAASFWSPARTVAANLEVLKTLEGHVLNDTLLEGLRQRTLPLLQVENVLLGQLSQELREHPSFRGEKSNQLITTGAVVGGVVGYFVPNQVLGELVANVAGAAVDFGVDSYRGLKGGNRIHAMAVDAQRLRNMRTSLARILFQHHERFVAEGRKPPVKDVEVDVLEGFYRGFNRHYLKDLRAPDPVVYLENTPDALHQRAGTTNWVSLMIRRRRPLSECIVNVAFWNGDKVHRESYSYFEEMPVGEDLFLADNFLIDGRVDEKSTLEEFSRRLMPLAHRIAVARSETPSIPPRVTKTTVGYRCAENSGQVELPSRWQDDAAWYLRNVIDLQAVHKGKKLTLTYTGYRLNEAKVEVTWKTTVRKEVWRLSDWDMGAHLDLPLKSSAKGQLGLRVIFPDGTSDKLFPRGKLASSRLRQEIEFYAQAGRRKHDTNVLDRRIWAADVEIVGGR